MEGREGSPTSARQSPAHGPAHARTSDLSANLRYLCGFYPSISTVCREIEVNRQQFNKYLSGASFPSLYVLRRIADFFGLDVDEICLPGSELHGLLLTRGAAAGGTPAAAETDPRLLLSTAFSIFRSDASVLRRYEGYYFRYNFAFDSSGRIVRSLFRIEERDGMFVTKLVERIQHRSNGSRKLTTLKYSGYIFAMSGCLFNVEYEVLMKSCIGHAAFSCVPRPGQRYMTGIQSSLSSSTGRPAASRVVLERLSGSPDVRKLLRLCGTFEPSDDQIDPDIVRLIGNEVSESWQIFGPARV